ncbi:MAG: hypothetical protein KJ852_00875 [Gammaproteobacteria bacterium]|nr:hypothetical protein [Gammaproteobacteria bacterium]MBU0788104.1 hypothetical protein [Gammaproteobacteria bacterium]MBU0815398.1 hypothetical protein [Gammaproteobacteria bacterium]MBU1785494.1 hypothetical protein [Gammaproteobacteria bacterium]
MQRIVGFLIVFSLGSAMAIPGFLLPGYSHTNILNLFTTGIGIYLMYRAVSSLFIPSTGNVEVVEKTGTSTFDKSEEGQDEIGKHYIESLAEIDVHKRRIASLGKLGYFTLILWPAFLGAGFMAFDAPNSDKQVWPYVLLFVAFSYGVLPFVTSRMSIWALARGRTKTAHVVAALPISIASLLFALPNLQNLLYKVLKSVS